MAISVSLAFIAPIPVGHRVQIIQTQRWATPLFGGQPQWEPIKEPIVVDVDTGIVYCETHMVANLTMSPLAMKPNCGVVVASMVEGTVASCLLATNVGQGPLLHTDLTVEPTPTAYRR
jgi:hypothetical protein